MDSYFSTHSLNDKQREAAEMSHDKLLVLAGAGSGKTRVLTHRVAWLLTVKGYPPRSIMAVTFTNKAALEMRYRIKNLLDIPNNSMWVGTFHGIAYRILCAHYQESNLPKDFHILDHKDQLKLLKRLFCLKHLDQTKWSPHQALLYINERKEKGLRPRYKKNTSSSVEAMWECIYQDYQDTCNRSGLVDFSELILRAHDLWLNSPKILLYYQRRFTNILVDEFQDINQVQYTWIRTLAGNTNNIMIVGDDDQSIYSWRGAQVENIQRFLNDFPNANIVRLEQNYRSTKNILKAANAIISNNNQRLGKCLWTAQDKGSPIVLYRALNELDEARFVVKNIKITQERGVALKDCAILYRSNAQSRILEEVLLQAGVPYRIYNSTRFFEKKEIKSTLAYLRLINNRKDDVAYENAVNTPCRGVGEQTLNKIRQIAYERRLTLWEASLILIDSDSSSRQSTLFLKKFVDLIDALDIETKGSLLHTQVNQVIKSSGLLEIYKKEDKKNNREHISNLEALVDTAKQFNYNEKDEPKLSPLQTFLSCTALDIYEDKSNFNSHQDAVQLMTLHTAKGLEFPQVFIVGMEEGLFPSQLSLKRNKYLEEERRLAYVGITRAMKKLTITYTMVRRLHGKNTYRKPSRFIRELPPNCIQEINLYSTTNYIDKQ